MSIRASVKAIPTLFRIGFAEAVAYRAEMLIWVLATTMPLVMYMMWSAVARAAPVGSFGQDDFLAYFLAAFIVRQLTGSWAAWQLNFEIRQGTLSMKLLRPIHPLITYATENLSYLPMRLVVTAPALLAILLTVGSRYFPKTAAGWALWFVGTVGGWAVIFLINVCIGSLALFMKSSLKLMDAYLAMSFVLSGYLIPVELFPSFMRGALNWLPFRYTLGLPIELLVSRHDLPTAALLVLRQWGWVAVLLIVATTLWKRGLKRYEAFGG